MFSLTWHHSHQGGDTTRRRLGDRTAYLSQPPVSEWAELRASLYTHTPVPEHVYVQHQHAHIGVRTQQEYTVAEGKEMIATKR